MEDICLGGFSTGVNNFARSPGEDVPLVEIDITCVISFSANVVSSFGICGGMFHLVESRFYIYCIIFQTLLIYALTVIV